MQHHLDVNYKGGEMIDSIHLRRLIQDVLITMNLNSRSAIELLMLTTAQESHCGTYLEQIGGGPALGIFQMEPNAYADIFNSYLKYKPKLQNKVMQFIAPYDYVSDQIKDMNLRGNILLQIAMARVHYLRFSERLPYYKDIEAIARYWKKYWNTELGAGTVDEAIANYQRYTLPESDMEG